MAGSLMMIFMMLFIVLGFVLWVWALIDMVRNSRESNEPLALWILIILFFPIVGSIIYFLVGRERFRKARNFDPQFNK